MNLAQQVLTDFNFRPGLSLLEDHPSIPSSSTLTSVDVLFHQVLSAFPDTVTISSADIEVRMPERFGEVDTPGFMSEAVVTALSVSKARTKVEVSGRLINQDGTTAMKTQLAILTDLPEPDPLLCPGSAEWIAELGSRLRNDVAFARLIESYDGTIGLAIGGRTVHLRCYGGAIIDASSSALRGADFTVAISGARFIDLLQADHNAFMKFAMQRHIKASGSGYEYLRMVSALVRIFDIVREIGVSARYIDACADHVAASTLPGGSGTSLPQNPLTKD